MKQAHQRCRTLGFCTRQLVTISFIYLIILAGCGHFKPPPVPTTPEASSLLTELENRNAELASAKGIGQVRLTYNNRPLHSRLAWAAQSPKKVRMEIMTISGQRLATLSSDGQKLYMLSHQENRFYKRSYTNSNLKSITQVPIQIEDLVALLQGKMPLRQYHTAVLVTRGTEPGFILTLLNRWGRRLVRIYLDQEKTAVEKLEMINPSGSIDYQVLFADMRDVSGFRVPFTLRISSAAGSRLIIATERYWANAEVSESLFRLAPLQ
jgi:outer membrane biogenesis lipoprotein LolB